MRLITRDRSFYIRLLQLAIPVALQNLITFAVNFADNLMVASLGDAAVSGVYMAGQIQTFLQLFSGGVEGAILILSAQYWGNAVNLTKPEGMQATRKHKGSTRTPLTKEKGREGWRD